ncbi:MAG TPA: hypothetical protein VLM38_07890, partial [Blastocatellia bacterium]|nr:hypothetical protein [Blastocatellia bacterium]
LPWDAGERVSHNPDGVVANPRARHEEPKVGEYGNLGLIGATLLGPCGNLFNEETDSGLLP